LSNSKPSSFVRPPEPACRNVAAESLKSAPTSNPGESALEGVQLEMLKPFTSLDALVSMGYRCWNDELTFISEFDNALLQFRQRDQFRRDYGYVLATSEVMERLATFLHGRGPVLDAGSGSGYLSRELVRLGVDMFAVDSRDYRVHHPDGRGYPIRAVYQLDSVDDATQHVTSRFGTVMMTWPPLNQPFALNVAQKMLPGQFLVYEGEMVGGCNADDAFFELMADRSVWEPLEELTARLNDVHVVAETLHDCWAVWRRVPHPESDAVATRTMDAQMG
jgi:hypothetical protein